MPMIDYDSIFHEFAVGNMMPFYRNVYPGLLTYAARFLGQSLAFMAEDCVQDTVLSAYEHCDDMEDTVHWRMFLLQGIRRRASNMVRHKDVADGYVSSVNDGLFGDDLNVVNDYSLELIHQELFDSLFAAIERLPEKYRQIFHLNFEQGLKNQEIAELLDVAEITVKKRKAKMIELLRRHLGTNADSILLLYILTAPLLTDTQSERITPLHPIHNQLAVSES